MSELPSGFKQLDVFEILSGRPEAERFEAVLAMLVMGKDILGRNGLPVGSPAYSDAYDILDRGWRDAAARLQIDPNQVEIVAAAIEARDSPTAT